MGSRRSPFLSKRNLQSPRPYSMYSTSSTLTFKSFSPDNLSVSSVPASSSYNDLQSAGNTSPNICEKHKRNSTGDLNHSGVDLVCSVHSGIDENDNSKKFVSSPPYSKKKSNSPSKKRVMEPPGPNAMTWVSPKLSKKLPAHGQVYGACLSKSGNCYVSLVTGKNERVIQTYDASGNLIKSFQCRVTKQGRAFEPYQIAETPDNQLAVACGNCVTVWSKEGKLIHEHGKNMFKFAKCIAVRSTGEIIVTDTDHNSVKMISANGQLISTIESDFHGPVGVAVDSEDNIIVVDWDNKIRIFDSENMLVKTFGTKGSKDGEIDLPYGVCVDCKDNIIIADMWNNRISLFTQQGQFLRHIVSGSILRPMFVSASKNMNADEYRLSVTDFSANALILFVY